MNLRYYLNNSIITPFYNEIKFRSKKTLNLYRNYDENLLNEIDSLKKIIKPKYNKNPKKILFITGYGLGSHYYNLELLLKLSLLKDGHSSLSLYCDKSVPCCEFSFDSSDCSVGNKSLKFKYGLTSKIRSYKCNACTSNIEYFLRSLNLPFESLKKYYKQCILNEALDFIKQYNYENFRNAVHKDIKIGEEAYASVLRASFMGDCTVKLGNAKLANQYLLSSYIQSSLYQEAYKSIKPDAIVLIHGIYQIHGIATKVANKFSIPVYVLGGGGIRKNTAIVCIGETYHH